MSKKTLKITVSLTLPCWRAWRRFRFIKRIEEGEHYTNAIIGYKVFKNGDWWSFSIYLPPVFIKISTL